MSQLSWLGALAILLSGLASQTAAAAPEERRVTLGYDLYAASLPVARLDLVLQLASAEYRVASSVRTLGLADVRVGWRVDQVSEGRLLDGKVQPARYSNVGEWRTQLRRVLLGYRDNEVIRIELSPSAKVDERPAVDVIMAAGTVDFMSAMVQVVLAASPEAACAGTRRIFDGRRRYDMTLLLDRRESLPPVRLGIFRGETVRCVATILRIAGFPANGDGIDIPNTLFMWLARDDRSGLVLPVKLQASTSYGTADIHLTDVAVDGKRQAQNTD